MTVPVPPEDAAHAAAVQLATLRKWVSRGHISPPDRHGRYDLIEIADWIEGRDQHHARIAESRYRVDVSHRYGDARRC